MGLFGRIVGGALSGVGAGMAQAAEARRQQGLELLRQQFQAQQADVAYTRTVERDDAKAQDARDLETIRGRNRMGEIAMTGKVQGQRDAAQHGYTMKEIGAKQINEQENIRLKSRLDRSNTEAEIRLRDNLESGDYRTVVRGQDGTYYGVTDRGLVATGVKYDPTAGAASSNGGGALTESEQQTAFTEARNAWYDGGKKGREPKASDFIGMTRAEFAASRGGAADEAPAAGGGLLSNPTRADALPPAARRGTPGRGQASATAAPADDAKANAQSVQDGEAFMRQFPRAAAAASREKTYTLADLREFAKQRGMTIEQARALWSGQGWKMTGAK